MTQDSAETFPLDHQGSPTLPLRGRARAVQICITLLLVLSAITAAALFSVPALTALSERKDPKDAPLLLVAGLGLVVAGCGMFLALAGAAVAFCMWIHRASRIAHLFRPQMEYTPGWAVGWYFIPIANLFKPYQVMRELSQVADPASDALPDHRSAPVSGIVHAWWACLLVGSVLQNVGGRLDGDLMLIGATINAVGTAIYAVAGILCLMLVARLTRQLETRQLQRSAETALAAEA